MKTIETFVLQRTIKIRVFAFLMICQMGFYHYVFGQNSVNINNSFLSNLANVNNNVVQLTLINNALNMNPQVIRSINVPRVQKQTKSSRKKLNTNFRIKHTTKITAIPLPKQSTASHKSPIIKKKRKQSSTRDNRVFANVSNSTNLEVEVQQSIIKPVVNNDANVLINPELNIEKENTIALAQSLQHNNEFVLKRNEAKSYTSNRKPSNLNKKTHHFNVSRRKKFNHLCCSTTKKMAKLFARDKRNRIDPTKCFVWS